MCVCVFVCVCERERAGDCSNRDCSNAQTNHVETMTSFVRYCSKLV